MNVPLCFPLYRNTTKLQKAIIIQLVLFDRVFLSLHFIAHIHITHYTLIDYYLARLLYSYIIIHWTLHMHNAHISNILISTYIHIIHISCSFLNFPLHNLCTCLYTYVHNYTENLIHFPSVTNSLLFSLKMGCVTPETLRINCLHEDFI